MTLLTIVANVCRLTGLRIPTEVVDSTDIQVQQLYGLANEAGDELARDFRWQALNREQTFVTTATEEQTDALPDDLTELIYNSFYDRTTRLQVFGPLTPQNWQAIKAQPQLNRVYLAFRERDGAFLMSPTPSAGDTIAYEYISSYWAKSASDVAQAQFIADTDTTYLSERLIQLSLRWRFLSAKNLDYAEAYRSYQTELQKEQARDGGSTMLNIGRNGGWYNVLAPPQITPGGFPG